MKLSYFFIIAIFLTQSCKTSQNILGMPEADFLKHNKARLVEAYGNVSVYKKQQDYWTHSRPETKFYYFQNGKLIEINEGERNPDIIVEKRER